MKTILQILIPTLLLSMGCQNEQPSEGYKINGSITDLPDSAFVYLSKRWDGNWIKLDSVKTNGNFLFSGSLDTPELLYVHVGMSRNPISFFAENNVIEISAQYRKFDEATITGSGIHNIFSEYVNERDDIIQRVNDAYYLAEDLKSKGERKAADSLERIVSELYMTVDETTKKYLFENTDNVIGPFLATQVYYTDEELQEADSALNLFKGEAQKTVYYSDFSKNIGRWKSVSIGQPAPEWSQPDSVGTLLSSDKFEGRYVLIDFWASWCGPCRVENPKMVQLYDDFRDKNFEIIGVSLDESKRKWLEAIKKDGLEWVHVSDLKGWSNSVSDLYGVKAIPQTVLIDPEGIIIAKNLRAESLRSKLEEIL